MVPAPSVPDLAAVPYDGVSAEVDAGDLNGPLDCSMQSDDPSLVAGISDAGICRTPAIQDDALARTSGTLRGRNLFDEVTKPVDRILKRRSKAPCYVPRRSRMVVGARPCLSGPIVSEA